MTIRLCWTCKQPATHALTRDGSIPLNACDNCTRIDRAEAEARGWTITKKGAEMNWTAETLRSGIALEVASDDHGLMGTPGTWYRVRQDSQVELTTRNRGDALRLFQRQVRLASGA
jgi:hypothetical protein